jgi:hypothetical protein
VTDGFEMDEFLFGSWYICRGTKAIAAASAGDPPGPALLAAE